MGSEEKKSEVGLSTPADASSKKGSTLDTSAGRLEPPTPVTLPLTKYERSRIVGSRALQISLGAPVLIATVPEGADPISIAEIELKANALPITIKRKLPGGRFVNIPLSKLAMEWV